MSAIGAILTIARAMREDERPRPFPCYYETNEWAGWIDQLRAAAEVFNERYSDARVIQVSQWWGDYYQERPVRVQWDVPDMGKYAMLLKQEQWWFMAELTNEELAEWLHKQVTGAIERRLQELSCAS